MDKTLRKQSSSPKVDKYLDEEERALIELIESDQYIQPKSEMTPRVRAAHRAVARATINEQRVKISLRLPESDLLALKAKALREGMPYQTLIGSILHKAILR